MPSANQTGSRRDRREFPRLVEAIGEDPARFLDWSLVRNGDEVLGENGRKLLVKARIQGIDRIETIRAWKAVERQLGRGPNDGPREGVIRLLEQREERLEAIGERPDRLPLGPRRPPSMVDTESVIPEPELTPLDKSRSHRRDVATDGGEDGAE